MSVAPLPSVPGRRPAQKLAAAGAARVRRPPTARDIRRRRVLITLTKGLLPLVALALLATIALWPEFERVADQERVAYHRMESASVDGTTMLDARYRGIDDHNRPYTMTAATAVQDGPDRVNLTLPDGDITMQNGTWLSLRAKNGVYMQHAQQLDLSHDVTLYRDDGTTLLTQSAAVDLHAGAAAGSDTVHAEGPFGRLDAHGFTVTDKGDEIQFNGPATLVMNGHTP